MGADFGRANVADDAQRRVIQIIAILIKLPIGFIERIVFVFAFVFPGEATALPDIDEAGVALRALRGSAHDSDMLFKAVIGPRRVGFRRRGLIQNAAQVNEMLVACRALRKLRRRPLRDKLLGRELVVVDHLLIRLAHSAKAG